MQKTLYGLKHSLQAWFDAHYKDMIKFGYEQNRADHTMFDKQTNDKITIWIVYVDVEIWLQQEIIKIK